MCTCGWCVCLNVPIYCVNILIYFITFTMRVLVNNNQFKQLTVNFINYRRCLWFSPVASIRLRTYLCAPFSVPVCHVRIKILTIIDFCTQDKHKYESTHTLGCGQMYCEPRDILEMTRIPDNRSLYGGKKWKCL